MKKTKTVFLIMLVFIMCLMTACGSKKEEPKEEVKESASSSSSEEKSNQTNKKYKDGEFIMTSDKVKLIGRTEMIDDILWFSYSGSGVEFNFKGKKCEIVLRGDTMATQASKSPRYAIYVDGEIIEKKTMDAMIEKVVALDAADTEEHVIRVTKLSESSDSTMGIVMLNCDEGAEISPTEQKSKKIEFVGDSITCGYGVDGKLGETYSTSNEDCTKAYAYKTAQKLDADYSLVSLSGYGIISGYTEKEKKPEQQLPLYYDKLGNSYGTFLSTNQPQKIDWNFENYKPDLVVINLGTNDASYTKGDPEKIEDYTSSYVAFLKHVKEKNPQAKILCVLGIMGQDLCPAVEETVKRYKEETNDQDIYYLKLDQQGSEVVVDYHPTEASHEHASDQVSEFIKTVIWG